MGRPQRRSLIILNSSRKVVTANSRNKVTALLKARMANSRARMVLRNRVTAPLKVVTGLRKVRLLPAVTALPHKISRGR